LITQFVNQRQRRTNMNRIKYALAAAAAVVLLAPALAAAHVTVQPKEVPAGSFTRLDVRVPNESDSAGTDRVEIELPDGFAFVSYEPVAGWEVKLTSEKLDQPIETDDGELTEQVKTVTWTATDPSAAIEPGQFRDFGLSVGLPDSGAPGDVLTFPAIQHYDDGETVRWIGEPESDHPAPQVTLTEAAEDHHAAAPAADPATEESADDGDEDGSSNGLAIAALIVGALGLVTGGVALLRGGRAAA
jgi:uncharacterized protein